MPRQLSPDELNAIEDAVVSKIPQGLSDEEFDRAFKPLMAQAVGIAENTDAPLQGSSLQRALGGLWKNLNPVTIAQGLYGAATHPIDTLSNIASAQASEFQKATQSPTIWEAGGHLAASAIPLIGPAAARSGELIASGDIAGGVGEGVGLVAPFAASGLLRARVGAQANAGVPAVLERQAAEQVAGKVLAPGNVAFRGRAEAIAPEILRRGMKGGRDDLAQAADEGMANAGNQIDAAIQSAGGPQSQIDIGPIVGRLQQKMADLTVNGQPIKGAEGRVAGLRARIDQLTQTARPQPANTVPRGAAPMQLHTFEDLRKIRDEQYRIADEAKAYRRMGNPALSDEGFAAAETGSAIRQTFGNLAPDLAKANADYTFFKTLGDVLDPAQGRPKQTAPTQGVTGGATTTGAVVGQMLGSKPATFVLSVVIPWAKKMRSEPAWQLADAQSKLRLAAAIRNGNVPLAQRMMLRIEQAGPRATSPNESQSRTTAPALSTP